MKTQVDNNVIVPCLLSVPAFNYGQLQRWEGKERFNYTIEVDPEFFFNKIACFFKAFRAAEIEENDTDEFPILEHYKKSGWLTLNELRVHDVDILEQLIKYHQYEILHLINVPVDVKTNYLYSVNTLDYVSVSNELVVLKGICFRYDVDIR